MNRRRKIALLLVTAYAVGVVWGEARLPFAAVKNLADYPLIKTAPSVSSSGEALQVNAVQRWYLNRSMNIGTGTQPPRISVSVKWNLGVMARVDSGHYMGPLAAEGLDCLYVCFFGAWVPVWKFDHVMA